MKTIECPRCHKMTAITTTFVHPYCDLRDTDGNHIGFAELKYGGASCPCGYFGHDKNSPITIKKVDERPGDWATTFNLEIEESESCQ